jgi:hypothetical protein
MGMSRPGPTMDMHPEHPITSVYVVAIDNGKPSTTEDDFASEQLHVFIGICSYQDYIGVCFAVDRCFYRGYCEGVCQTSL